MRYGIWIVALVAVFTLSHRTAIRNWIEPPPPIHVPAGFQAVLYGAEWCPYCARARKFFRDNNVPFREYDVEKSEAGHAQYEQLGGGGVPIVLIDDKVIYGYDEEAMRDALQKLTPRPAPNPQSGS